MFVRMMPSPDLGTLLGVAIGHPVVSVSLTLLVGGAILAALRARGRAPESVSDAAPYRREQLTLAAIAVALILVTMLHVILRGYVTDFGGEINWWRFALPILVAITGNVILLGQLCLAETRRLAVPVAPTRPRTWRTYLTRAGLLTFATSSTALVATTIWAGSMASAGTTGEHAWLEIPIPNEPDIDPLRVWFYGWSYGVPVLAALVVLLLCLGPVLHFNAVRRYRRPSTRIAEDAARGAIASAALRVSGASVLLALAATWRVIADAAGPASLVILGQNGDAAYNAAWQYAELATVLGWMAPVVEVAAFVLLFTVIIAGAPRARVAERDSQGDIDDLLVGA